MNRSSVYGQVLKAIGGKSSVARAFPAPLDDASEKAPTIHRPRFTATPEILQSLTQIERFLDFLENAALSPRWIARMQERAFVLEAHHTTHIEGTTLTLKQSEKLLRGECLPDTDPNDVQELRNYRDAFELVAALRGAGAPITEILIREIHSRLVADVRGNSADPGRYRSVQNYVTNSKTNEVIYTPPLAVEVSLLMGELVALIRKQTQLHPVLVAGIAQFQLVHIHPFLDGNGRTARLLSTLCLDQSGYDFKRLLTISEYYDRNRLAYYEAIQTARDNNMDLTSWLEFFTGALATQLGEIRERGEQAIEADKFA